MRRGRVFLAAALVLTGACNSQNLFSAKSDVAAEAGGVELKSDRVAAIIGKSGGSPNIQAAEFVSNLWLDYTVFAEAVAHGALKTDSASVAKVMWPQIEQSRVQAWHDTVLAKRTHVSPGAIDSAYGGDDYRLFQHIIVIPTGNKPADTAKAKASIQAAQVKLKGGYNFGKLASEISADGSKNDEGYLMPGGPKGQFVKEFEEAAWALAPGQVSGVVQSQFGYHLIRRPPLEEVRTRMSKGLQERMARKTDSIYLAELTQSAGLKVATGAGEALRSAATDVDGARKSSKTVVSLKGGDIKLSDAARWISAMPMNIRMQIQAAPDSILGEFAKGLAQNVLLLRQADSAGVKVPTPAWQFMQLQYQNQIQGIKNELGLAVPELSDSSKLSVDQKSKLAAEKVDDFFTRLVEGRAQMRPVLPSLASDLRATYNGRVNKAGVTRAVELATATFKKDSAAAGAAPQPGLIQPAPGGPPVPTPPPAKK